MSAQRSDKYDPAVGITCNIAGNNRLAGFIHIQKDPLYIWGISVPPCSSYKITVLIKHIKILILPGILASGKVIPESFHIFSIIQVLQIIAPVRKRIPVVLDKHSKGFVYLLISRQQMLGIFLIDIFFDKIVVKNNPEKKAKNFLDGLFKIWGEEVEVITNISDGILKIELKGDNMGSVIGKRGETLDALQHLTSLNVNTGDDEFIKVSLDTENYREKRNQTLAELAKKLAVRVAKTRKNMTLEPMNSYERRIIHATLQDDKYVTTYSVGQSPNRKVVIAYGKKSE